MVTGDEVRNRITVVIPVKKGINISKPYEF